MNTAAQWGRIGVLAITLGVAAPGVAAVACGVAAADPADGPSGPAGRHSAADPGVAARHRVQPATRATPATGTGQRPGSTRGPLPAAAQRFAGGSTPHPGAGAVTAPGPIAALFANTSPRVSAAQTGQSSAGLVSGTVEVNDPDSGAVSVAVARAPGHGTVTLSGGGYTYTPDPALAHTGFVDSFAVVATDAGGGFHVHGVAGLINLLTFGLIGASGHTGTTTVRVSVAPFNNPPTATVHIDPPDPLTGVTTGVVLGSDPNGDALSYSAAAMTAKGTVIVSATGEFTYTPTNAADIRDTFTVTVDDGYGGTVAVPVVLGAGGLSTFCGCTLMPASTVFHADVRGLPVLPQSDRWTALLGGTLRAVWGGDPWLNNTAGMPVNVVDADRPTEAVIFNRGYSTTGPSIDDTPYAIPDRPLVEGMPDIPAWDRHLLVLQEGSCISQELYNVANGVELPANSLADALGNALYAGRYGSAWIAEAGVHIDMNSASYPVIGWANASRLPYLPLILRPDDLERGAIDHMLGIAIAKDRGTGYTWPARAGDGTGTNPDGVPMGTVLRLRADFPVAEYDPATQIVLRALQRHGAVVFDSVNAGQEGATLLAMSNGWTGTAYLTAQRELRTIPLSAFEAVDVPGIALDPATGWTIRT